MVYTCFPKQKISFCFTCTFKSSSKLYPGTLSCKLFLGRRSTAQKTYLFPLDQRVTPPPHLKLPIPLSYPHNLLTALPLVSWEERDPQGPELCLVHLGLRCAPRITCLRLPSPLLAWDSLFSGRSVDLSSVTVSSVLYYQVFVLHWTAPCSMQHAAWSTQP